MTTLKQLTVELQNDIINGPKLVTKEIIVDIVDNAWVNYVTFDGKDAGAVHVKHFPDKPKKNKRYYLILFGSDVKGVAKKIEDN